MKWVSPKLISIVEHVENFSCGNGDSHCMCSLG